MVGSASQSQCVSQNPFTQSTTSRYGTDMPTMLAIYLTLHTHTYTHIHTHIKKTSNDTVLGEKLKTHFTLIPKQNEPLRKDIKTILLCYVQSENK